MTTQEAIKQLRDLIKDRQSFIDNDEEHDEVFKADIAALCIAIIAAEKQILEKPMRKPENIPKHFNKGVYSYYCPICGKDLLDEINDCFLYCPDCGQALDWGDNG